MDWSVSQETKLNILFAIFVASIISANMLGGKIADFGIFEASVGILVFPFTFLITDIVQEVYGKPKARSFVNAGMIAMVLIFITTFIAVKLPFAARSHITAEQFNPVFGLSLRMFVASVTAYIVSQHQDIFTFGFLKEKTKGRFLWLRNNVSTAVGQFIDTTLFMFLFLYYVPWLPAIINTSPKFTVVYLFTLIIPYWLIKMLFSVCHTPFCYLGVWWLRQGKDINTRK